MYIFDSLSALTTHIICLPDFKYHTSLSVLPILSLTLSLCKHLIQLGYLYFSRNDTMQVLNMSTLKCYGLITMVKSF